MRTDQDNHGYLMIIVLFSLTGIATITVAGLSRTMTEQSAARQAVKHLQLFHEAEGAIDQALTDFRTALAGQEDPQTDATCDPDALPGAAGWQPLPAPLVAPHTQDYCIAPEDSEQSLIDAVSGDYSFVRTYRAVGRARAPDATVTQTIVQRVQRKLTPVFQYEVFYNDPLEIEPGANMTLSGRVFTNSDLFLYPPQPGTALWFDSVATAGHFYASPGRTEGNPPGAIHVRAYRPPGSPPAPYVTVPQDPDTSSVRLSSLSEDWTTLATALWGGSFKTEVHGVTTRPVPQIDSIAPGGPYDQKALACGVQLAENSVTGNIDVRVSGSRQLSWEAEGAEAILTTGTMPDYREQLAGKPGPFPVATIDVTTLQQRIQNHPELFPVATCSTGFNGVVYASRQATVNTPEGFRLKNGATFTRNMSFVTNMPLYIQGHFNCGSTDCTTGTRRGVAVIADALTILSANWESSQNRPNLNDRTAVNTTVNAAIIAGLNPTVPGGGQYSGGFENYPRLLEHWGGKTLTMKGAFIQLWRSQIATAPWKKPPQYYWQAQRNWSFDENFLNSSLLPPLTPTTLETVLLVWDAQ